MSITPIGIVYFFVLILLIRKNKFIPLVLLCLSAELFVEIGYVISFGSLQINYGKISEIVLGIYSIFIIYNNKQIKEQFFPFIMSLFIPIILLLIFPSEQLAATINVSWDMVLNGYRLEHPVVNSFVLQQTLQFLIELLICSAIYKTFQLKDYEHLISIFSKIINCFLVIGFVEFLAKNLFGCNESWGNVIEMFFGKSTSTIYDARVRGGNYELTLFTKEASHYAYCLTIMLLVKIAHNINARKKYLFDKWILLNIVLLLFSMSFSSVLFGLFLFLVLLLYRWYVIVPNSIKVEKTIFTIVIIFLLGSLSSIISGLSDSGFFSRRILSAIQEVNVITTNEWETSTESLEWSNRVRMLSVFKTVMLFLDRPIFGYGLGSVCSHGATSMLLSGIGIVGTYLWSKIYFFSNTYKRVFGISNRIYLLSFIMFMSINMLNSLGLRPFYELSAIVAAISLNFIFKRQK